MTSPGRAPVPLPICLVSFVGRSGVDDLTLCEDCTEHGGRLCPDGVVRCGLCDAGGRPAVDPARQDEARAIVGDLLAEAGRLGAAAGMTPEAGLALVDQAWAEANARPGECPACDGTGLDVSRALMCDPACDGSHVTEGGVTLCPRGPDPCAACDGRGRVPSDPPREALEAILRLGMESPDAYHDHAEFHAAVELARRGLGAHAGLEADLAYERPWPPDWPPTSGEVLADQEGQR